MLDTDRLREYTSPVQADLEAFDKKLHDCLRGDTPLVSSIARHLLRSRGKRIRPAFLFLSSRAAQAWSEYAVEASLSIELIHTATLLHDDVVDESDRRRGQETVNYKWKNLISVLMGDYIFGKAFRVMVDTHSIDLIEAISLATERVSVGELRQIEETKNYSLSEEEYLDIIANKTASLFSVSCAAGPILVGHDNRRRAAFTEFGEKIGTAFQVADDLLDFVGDPEVTGKELGNDLFSGKVTLPLIHSLRTVGEAAGREITSHLKNPDGEESFRRVYKFIVEQGGVEYAYNRANQLGDQALDAISFVEPSAFHDSLTNLVKYAVARAS